MEQRHTLTSGKLQIPCRITRPEGMPVKRVILGVHGFGGSSADVIQKGIAEEMALFCDAMVRFDFPAHGENPEPTLTLEGCQDTLLAAAQYAWELFPEAEELCVFATGFGAYVTLSVLEDLLAICPELRLVVQTPSFRMDNTLLNMIQMSAQTLRVMEKAVLPIPGRPLTIHYEFYEDLQQTMMLTTQPIPMLILHGEADDYIPMEDIRNFRRINEQSKLVLIPGATHQFLEEGAWDMVLDLTRDWFAFQQVLLCDWE